MTVLVLFLLVSFYRLVSKGDICIVLSTDVTSLICRGMYCSVVFRSLFVRLWLIGGVRIWDVSIVGEGGVLVVLSFV